MADHQSHSESLKRMSDAGGLQITQWDCWKVAGKRPLNDTLTFWWCSDWLSNATAVITVRHGIDHLAGCAPIWGGGLPAVNPRSLNAG